jgi:hypothetical protein
MADRICQTRLSERWGRCLGTKRGGSCGTTSLDKLMRALDQHL